MAAHAQRRRPAARSPARAARARLSRRRARQAPARCSPALALVVLLIALSAIQAEVDPKTFLAKIGGFFSYFDRLATLDTGDRVWTDPAAWFWGFKRSARLIGETILMAYVGTLTGRASPPSR